MGAWIETTYLTNMSETIESHPAWVRGLKPIRAQGVTLKIESHPAWVRGLKLGYIGKNKPAVIVAPCVGAWIETTINDLNVYAVLCRTLRGCVD